MMTKTRPTHFDADVHELYDWFKANGVDEWLPRPLSVSDDGGKLTYTSFRWEGPRGWEIDNIAPVGDATEPRTVPLVVPLTNRIRQIVANGSA